MSYVEVCQKHGQHHTEICGECFDELKEENVQLRETITRFQEDAEMFLNEHNENVRLHFENVDLKEQNTRLREALSEVITETIVYNGVPEIERIGVIALAALEKK